MAQRPPLSIAQHRWRRLAIPVFVTIALVCAARFMGYVVTAFDLASLMVLCGIIVGVWVVLGRSRSSSGRSLSMKQERLPRGEYWYTLLVYRLPFSFCGALLGLLAIPVVNRPSLIPNSLDYAGTKFAIFLFAIAFLLSFLSCHPKRLRGGIVNLVAAIIVAAVLAVLFLAFNVNSAWNNGGNFDWG